MKKIVCDRCKKEIKQKKEQSDFALAIEHLLSSLCGRDKLFFDYVIGKSEEWSDGKRVFPADICPECEKEFVAWFLLPEKKKKEAEEFINKKLHIPEKEEVKDV